MPENMPPDPANPSPTPGAEVDLAQVLQALQTMQSVQLAILEELQAQSLATLLPVLESSAPPEPPPKTTEPVPLIFQHLNQLGVGRAGQWVMQPLRWGVVKPVEWLIVKPFHWTVYRPLNYLVFSPLIFTLKQIPHGLSPLAKGLIGWMESIEGKEWEQDLDRLASALDEMGILKVLDAAGKLALILGVISWIWGSEDRAKQTYYQAWDMINSASSVDSSPASTPDDSQDNKTPSTNADQNSSGATDQNRNDPKLQAEGGRSKAMKDLFSANQSLAGIQAPGAIFDWLDLSPMVTLSTLTQLQCWQTPYQEFPEVKNWEDLKSWAENTWLLACSQSANLSNANLRDASLYFASLQGANLYQASLEKASLNYASLQGAWLYQANLERARLGAASLQKATLSEASLQKAILDYADLEGATLVGAELQEASLERTNLAKADLSGAQLNQTQLLLTQLTTAKNLEAQQLDHAYLCATKLPPDLKLDPDRDCDLMPKYWVERGWSETEQEAQDFIKQAIEADAKNPD